MTKLIMTKGHVEDVSGYALSIKTAQIANPKTGLNKEGYIIYAVKTKDGKITGQKILNLEALRSIDVNGQIVCLNGAFRVDTPEWVNDRRQALVKAAKLARTTVAKPAPVKTKENEDEDETPTPSTTQTQPNPDDSVPPSTPEDATDNEELETPAPAPATTPDGESENPDGQLEITDGDEETSDEGNEDPAPADADATEENVDDSTMVLVKFENCPKSKAASKKVPSKTSLASVFAELKENGLYEKMTSSDKYVFDYWEITSGDNTMIVNNDMLEAGINFPITKDTVCNGHWGTKAK